MLSFEFVYEVVDQAVVKVFTTQMCITGSGLDFEDTLLDGQERDIECSSSQVEDQYISLALGLFIETVGNGCGGGFVDDSEDVETGNETSVFGGLALGVVEVGGDCDDGIVDGTTEI